MHLCTTFILLLILLLMLSLSCILYYDMLYGTVGTKLHQQTHDQYGYHKEHKDVSYETYIASIRRII